jgi:hypothetical protein
MSVFDIFRRDKGGDGDEQESDDKSRKSRKSGKSGNDGRKPKRADTLRSVISMPTIEHAIDLMRASVPEDVMFDLCGVPLSSAMGRTEFCRIGCDVGLDWDDIPWMRLLHRERVSTKRSLANTRGRAHLDGRAFRNDPDVFFLRYDVRLTNEQRTDLINTDAALGGMFLTSDDVSVWDDRQRLAFKKALATFTGKES